MFHNIFLTGKFSYFYFKTDGLNADCLTINQYNIVFNYSKFLRILSISIILQILKIWVLSQSSNNNNNLKKFELSKFITGETAKQWIKYF